MSRERAIRAILPKPVVPYAKAHAQTMGIDQMDASDLNRLVYEEVPWLIEVAEAARDLFDNRVGWSQGRNPHAPREAWAKLGAIFYGPDDERVIELEPITFGADS